MDLFTNKTLNHYLTFSNFLHRKVSESQTKTSETSLKQETKEQNQDQR